MTRTVSVHDHDTGITASVTIEGSDEEGRRTTEIRFIADSGRSIAADDLRLIEAFGLKLPAPPNEIRPAPAAQPAATTAPASKPAARKPVPRRKDGRKYFTGKRPDDDALLQLWLDNGRTAAAIAEKLGCSAQTVYGWIAAARARGVNLPAKEQ